MRCQAQLLGFTLALSLAACGGDDGPATVDAAPAASMVMVSGVAQTVETTSTVPLAGATIEAFARAGGTPLATTTSAADGTYSLTLATSGTAIDGYLKGTSAGRIDTYLYPPAPLAADTTDATMLIVNQQTFGLLATLGGVTQDPAKGFIAMVVRDAAGDGVAGATVTVTPAGTARIIYAVNALPNQGATATDASGGVFIANTNPGDVTVDAAMGATAFREHVVNARAGVVTTTVVQP